MAGIAARPRRPFAAAAALGLLVLAGCSPTGPSSERDGGPGFVTAKGGKLATAARGHRAGAPDVSGRTLSGAPAGLSDYRGKVVVLNIWGSWCDPCRTEAPGFQRAWEKYRDQGVQFLGLNTRDNDVANPRRFEQERGITYPSIFDPDGVELLKFPKGSLNPQFIPTTVVIDREGGLAARGFGGQSYENLESLLLPVLAEQP